VLLLITAFLASIRVFFCSPVSTSLEILALRQQVAVLKRKRPATRTEPSRPLLLDLSTEPMAAMVGCSGHRETADGGRMASGGLSTVLALAIAATRRPTQGERGDADSHSPHGG
jgi:hypothetical protein